MSITLNRAATVKGRYSVMVKRSDGSIKHECHFNNVLTDSYFASTSTSEIVYLGVGTGTTPEDRADTLLESQVGSRMNGNGEFTSVGNIGGNLYKYTLSTTVDFGLGNIVGDITELGASRSPSANGTLISRSLIKDSGGNPITISVAVDEQLIIIWHFEVTLDATPITYQDVDINGTLTDVTLRMHGCHEGSSGLQLWFRGSQITNVYSLFYPTSMYVSNGVQPLLTGMSTAGAAVSGTVNKLNNPTADVTRQVVPIDNDTTTAIATIKGDINELNTPSSNFLYFGYYSHIADNSMIASLEFSVPFTKLDTQELDIRIKTVFSRA